ncbi:uncharacterized protein VP01_6533g2 [Puccinia sorghi]|uniref:Uncharacterized protein n=1 Tax=Puccinia sorghi TaxID=27349 RepID=A0A0L6UFE9_9BASI|nr:uncharacterized protein VP01_6533g2 [Puccinia sorghi]
MPLDLLLSLPNIVSSMFPFYLSSAFLSRFFCCSCSFFVSFCECYNFPPTFGSKEPCLRTSRSSFIFTGLLGMPACDTFVNLGYGLPSAIPSGDIHCPVCEVIKSTKFNPLSSTFRPAGRLDIMAVYLIGPFQVDSVDRREYLLTMRDIGTGFCFAKTLKTNDKAYGHIIC